MKSILFSAAALAGIVAAAPIEKRASATGPTDGQILNYALTLEHLEDTFYREGLAKFSVYDFEKAGFSKKSYDRVKTIAGDEATHVSFLTSALTAAGVQAVQECKYDFGYTDVKGFLATASVLEGVGVSAYLGAAADIMTKAYITAAGSILTVEARHSAYIRNVIKENPFPQPFDTPLDYNEVYTLAAPFFVSCPASNPPLPVKAFPALIAHGEGSIKVGSEVYLTTDAKIQSGTTVYAAFITITGPIIVKVEDCGDKYKAIVPKGLAGQTYVVLTNSNATATDDNIIAGPGVFEVSD